MTLNIERFKSLFNLNKDSLGSTMHNIVEYTVNLPSNKADKIYDKVVKALNEKYEDNIHYFELGELGKKKHLHGRVKFHGSHFREGAIAEVAETVIKAVDKRYKLNWRDNYYRLFERYQSPLVCIQYSDTAERAEYWEQYIKKNNN